MKERLKSTLYPLALAVAPSLLFQVQHVRMHRRFGSHWYWPNLRQPRTFNERLLRSKMDGSHNNLTHLVDKAEVKEWVADRVGADAIIPTLGVYDHPENVPIDELPRPCILKPTHASGQVVILRGSTDEPEPDQILPRLARWHRMNFWAISGEPQYRRIQPRIICEPLLGNGDLPDYKFFCFRGKPVYVQVDLDRHTRHVRRFYDMEWNAQPFTLRYPMAEREVERPRTLEHMQDIARTLSNGLDFVRVDLYSVDDKVYFGELTFHPESGSAPFSDYVTDQLIGNLMINSEINQL